jgi:hypothetical protein
MNKRRDEGADVDVTALNFIGVTTPMYPHGFFKQVEWRSKAPLTRTPGPEKLCGSPLCPVGNNQFPNALSPKGRGLQRVF